MAASAGLRNVQTATSAPVASNNGLSGSVSGHGGSLIRGSEPPDNGSTLSAEDYCCRHKITVIGNNVPPPCTTFEDMGLPSEILNEVQNAGFSAPTPIQAQSWSVALEHRDIVAIAKPGSGKTLGYLLPGFMHLKHTRNNSQMGPTVLVLSPTGELATQIQEEAMKFGKSLSIAVVCLHGGAPKDTQLRDIDKGADVVVATPGRLNEILLKKRISLHQVSYLVLDEVDRMLDMGFEPQIRKIVKEIPAGRRTLMYTATWSKVVRKIASDLLVKFVQVNIGNVNEIVVNKSITQHVEVLASMEKERRLEQILLSQEPGSKIIIFCSTKDMCDHLSRTLTRQFGAAAIHGDKSQTERDRILSQFRTGRTPVLVATDVAARGLDVKDIRVVINYDFPTGVPYYVHRIERTGRTGATGMAYTFFGNEDARYAAELIKVLQGAKQRVPPEIRNLASRWKSSGSGGGRSASYYGDGGRGMALQPETLYYLDEVMEKAPLEKKKDWVRDLFEAMIWRIAHGTHFGSLDPKQIEIYDDRAYLPNVDADEDADEEDLLQTLHPPYFFSVQSFITKVYASDYQRMSQTEQLVYEDFVSLLGTVTTLRQLILLRHHPHMQTENESFRFLTEGKRHRSLIQQEEKAPPKGTTSELIVSPTMGIKLFRFYWCLAPGDIALCDVIGTIRDPGGYESYPVSVFKIGEMYCLYPRTEEGEQTRGRGRNLEICGPAECFDLWNLWKELQQAEGDNL